MKRGAYVYLARYDGADSWYAIAFEREDARKACRAKALHDMPPGPHTRAMVDDGISVSRLRIGEGWRYGEGDR
jgi:hypothetical protein